MSINTNIKNTFKVRKTVIEMLDDRGYNIEEFKDVTYEEFSLLYNLNKINIYTKTKDNKHDIYVYFNNTDTNLTKSEFKSKVKKIHEDYHPKIKIIFILKYKINSIIKSELNKDIYKNIEIFLNKNLFYNITKHVLVPKHILLTETEKKDIMKKFNVTEKQFPKILETDPVVKYYGMKVGDV